MTSPEKANSDRRGRAARYQNGNIYWTSTTGAHEVHGAILDEFAKQAGVNGVLKYPTSDTRSPRTARAATPTSRTGGSTTSARRAPSPCRRRTSPSTRAWAASTASSATPPLRSAPRATSAAATRTTPAGGSTCARARSSRSTAPCSPSTSRSRASTALGYPANDLVPAGDGRKIQWFEKGLVFYTPTTGAFGLWGDILSRYADNGGVTGYLRYPTSEPTPVGDGRHLRHLRAGPHLRLVHHLGLRGPRRRAHHVPRRGRAHRRAGYPTSELDPRGTPGGRFQRFENGTIQYVSDSDVQVTLNP
ncbi:MAG: hypothetical protein R2711_09105 [Acidimicrobiales bacterium]